MLLCLDAGNTRLKFGVHDGTAWRMQGATDYAGIAGLPDQLPARPTTVVACNVAGEAARRHIEALARRLTAPLEWLTSSAAACGVSNGYDTPAQLGADRWAGLIGARGLHADACVVVLAGTATTIDALDAAGRYLGGLILPGLEMMRNSLARNTADLPQASGRYRPLATNTDDAIVSGALHATLGALERVRATLESPVTCLLSGGAAAELLSHVDAPCRPVANLVLEGLARYSLAK